MKKSRKSPVKDFSFKIDSDRLLEFSKISIAGRLKWLEDANRFIATIDNGRLMREWRKEEGR